VSYRRRCWRCHGAVTETRTRDQIKEKFGSYVRDFIAPPDDTFARGNEAGQITDDFSAAYTACQQIISWGGKIDSKCVITALLRWAETEKYFTRFAGPTTKAAVAALRGEAQPRAFVPVNDNGKATNYGGVNIGGDTDNEAGIELLHSFHGPGILHKLAEAGALVSLNLGGQRV
jgi:ADP-ribosylglycohydrolase